MSELILANQATVPTTPTTGHVSLYTQSGALKMMNDAGGVTTFSGAVVVSVLDFGAVGDGITDDTVAIQAALDVGGGYLRNIVVLFPYGAAGLYRVTDSLDCTDRRGILISSQPGVCIVSEATGLAALDLSGSRNIVIENLEIVGDAANPPLVGIFAARTTATYGTGAGEIVLDHMEFDGSFSGGALCAVAAEVSKFNVYIRSSAVCGAYGMWIGAYNDLSYTSKWATVNNSVPSMVSVSIPDCDLMLSSSPAAIPIVLGRHTAGVNIERGYIAGNAAAAATIQAFGDHLGLNIHDVAIEHDCADNILFSLHASTSNEVNMCSIAKTGSSMYTHAAIYAVSGITFRDLSLDRISNSGNFSSHTVVIFDKVYKMQAPNWGIGPNSEFDADTVEYSVMGDYGGTTIAHPWMIENICKSSSADFPGHAFLDSYPLIVGNRSDANLAKLSRLLYGTASWNPGTVADGTSATFDIPITNCTASGWLCLGFSLGLSPVPTGLILSASARDGNCQIMAMNHTGGGWTPGALTARAVVAKVEAL